MMPMPILGFLFYVPVYKCNSTNFSSIGSYFYLIKKPFLYFLFFNLPMDMAMDKKADGVICAHLLCFLTIFNETRSISLSFRGCLNRALRSDLTPLHSAHFTTAQRGLCTDFQTFLFIKVESWFFVCGIELRFHNIHIHPNVGTLITKQYSIRMFTKSKFMPAHQITAL